MQLLLTMKNTGVIDIPVNYNYLLQSAIYNLLSEQEADYAKMLHDTAFGAKTKYKFFTFGEIVGRNHFHDKKLYFEGDIKLEIRSESDEFISILNAALVKSESLSIGQHKLSVKSVRITDYRIYETFVNVHTISPVIAKIQSEENKSVYFSPQDVRFIRRLRETFERKYEVYFNKTPQSTVDILPYGQSKKIITMYKDTWITAYHGYFQLYGKPEYLQFLYNIGLGVKTSLGFGMFEIVENN